MTLVVAMNGNEVENLLQGSSAAGVLRIFASCSKSVGASLILIPTRKLFINKINHVEIPLDSFRSFRFRDIEYHVTLYVVVFMSQ